MPARFMIEQVLKCKLRARALEMLLAPRYLYPALTKRPFDASGSSNSYETFEELNFHLLKIMNKHVDKRTAETASLMAKATQSNTVADPGGHFGVTFPRTAVVPP